MAKNKIKRSLTAIIDPHPTSKQVDDLWEYFNASCAYCGISITRDTRTGHVDHVVSSALGGSNCIHNHVLSCARCNGDEKREESWESFLAKKATDPTLQVTRHAHISAWLARSASDRITLDTRTRANLIINRALADFESAVREIRDLRKSGT